MTLHNYARLLQTARPKPNLEGSFQSAEQKVGRMADRLEITASISIYEHELSEKFVTAGGPGGQNVNKLATAVQLRFHVAISSLPERVKENLRKIAGSRLTGEDEVLILANRFRTQEKNRVDARARLVELVREAAKPPPPKRKPTKPSLSARKKRVDSKVKRGTVKRLRKPVEPGGGD